MITIDRESKSSLVKLLKDAKDRLKKGRVIAIFPEGTRGRGDKILKFKSGSQILAEKLSLTVQPILIVGSRKIFDSQNFKATGKDIKVIYLPAVNPVKGSHWYEKLYIDMKNEFAKYLKAT